MITCDSYNPYGGIIDAVICLGLAYVGHPTHRAKHLHQFIQVQLTLNLKRCYYWYYSNINFMFFGIKRYKCHSSVIGYPIAFRWQEP